MIFVDLEVVFRLLSHYLCCNIYFMLLFFYGIYLYFYMYDFIMFYIMLHKKICSLDDYFCI